MNELNKSLLQLFNVVLEDTSDKSEVRYSLPTGTVMNGKFTKALYDDVVAQIGSRNKDSDLTNTFYKLWSDIENATDEQLFVDQMVHYMTTYGNAFPGIMFIPNENFNVEFPNIDKVPVRIVNTVNQSEAIDRIETYLNSGIALEQATMHKLVTILSDMDYPFTEFKNKEANMIAASLTGILPAAPQEFLRYVIFVASESTLLIKNTETIAAITNAASDNNDYVDLLNDYIDQHGKKNLAKVFNRFKPLFLAMKNLKSKTIINSVAKLSKKAHEPLVQTALNFATSKEILKSDMHWLDNATSFALLRALDVIILAENNPTDFTYRIRNGKLFSKTKVTSYDRRILKSNFSKILFELKGRVSKSGTVYIPEGIDYGLPTSEKSYIGNIPAMTRFTSESLNVGMYWENSMGARDLDLSSTDIDGSKVGWNSSYRAEGAVYSGDVTNAPNGGNEYLRFTPTCNAALVHLNVYDGSENSKYDLIVSHGAGKDVMSPGNLIARAGKVTRNNQSILGFVNPTGHNVEFILTEFDGGSNTVAGDSDVAKITLNSLLFRNKHALRLATVLEMVGYTVTDDKDIKADVDLSIDNLNKDMITSLFL